MHASIIASFRLVLYIRPLTLETFSAMPTYMMNTCGKFHYNSSTNGTPSTKYKAIAWREIRVNSQRTPARHTRGPRVSHARPALVNTVSNADSVSFLSKLKNMVYMRCPDGPM